MELDELFSDMNTDKQLLKDLRVPNLTFNMEKTESEQHQKPLKIRKISEKLSYSINQNHDETRKIPIEAKSRFQKKMDLEQRLENEQNVYAPPTQSSRYGPSEYEKRIRKFSGIDEEDYFVFVEDYDKFIGEFVSDQNLKVERGFINHNEYARIYYTKMQPQNKKPIASLLMVHGFGHTGKYLDLGAAIAKGGFVVHLFDLRGFGFSGGKRYNPSLQEIHQDIIIVMKSQVDRKLPFFVYGHGYGASIVTSLLLRNNFNISGVILSSIMLTVESIEKSNYGGTKIFLIKQLGEFFKDFMVNNVVNPTALTKSCYNIKRFVDDRICVPFLGLRFLSNLLSSFDFIVKEIKSFKYPVLMIHGLKDQICDPRRAMNLYRDLGSDEQTKIWYTDGFHEPFSDYENERYKVDIIKWLKSRVHDQVTIPLGKVSHGKTGMVPRSKIKRKIFFSLVVLVLYLKGLSILRNRKLYMNNKALLFMYPLFWFYKLGNLGVKTMFKGTRKFLVNLLIETKLIKLTNQQFTIKKTDSKNESQNWVLELDY